MIVFFHMSPGISAWLLFIVLMFFALVAVSLSHDRCTCGQFDEGQRLADLNHYSYQSFGRVHVPGRVSYRLTFKVSQKFLPQYWLLETIGLRQEDSMLSDIMLNLVILLAFALMLFLIAVYKFSRSRELKSFY